MGNRSVVSNWVVHPVGAIEVLFKKQVMGGDLIVSESNHRTGLDPDTDIDMQEKAVRNHLEKMGFPLSGDGWQQMKEAALAARGTPEAIQWIRDKNEAIAASSTPTIS